MPSNLLSFRTAAGAAALVICLAGAACSKSPEMAAPTPDAMKSDAMPATPMAPAMSPMAPAMTPDAMKTSPMAPAMTPDAMKPATPNN